jgi:hypothetical protein
MVATFLLPPPRPPDTSGGAPLASIPKGQIYIETLKNHGALQGASLGGKISHRGGDTMLVRDTKITRTTTPTQRKTTVSHNLSSVVSLMQRMYSDQAHLLAKLHENQEKQARRRRHAARKAKKAADETRALQLQMLSLMRNLSRSHSISGQNNKESSKNKSVKSTYGNKDSMVNPVGNQDVTSPSTYEFSMEGFYNLDRAESKSDKEQANNSPKPDHHTNETTTKSNHRYELSAMHWENSKVSRCCTNQPSASTFNEALANDPSKYDCHNNEPTASNHRHESSTNTETRKVSNRCLTNPPSASKSNTEELASDRDPVTTIPRFSFTPSTPSWFPFPMIFDQPAISCGFQNHTLSQRYWFNMFPDHPT